MTSYNRDIEDRDFEDVIMITFNEDTKVKQKPLYFHVVPTKYVLLERIDNFA
jgi:hypothetical protein